MADYVILTCLIPAVIGGITTRPFLLIIGFLFLIYLLLNVWYEKTVVNKLTLQNPKQTLRLFPGDESTLSLHFQNNSLFPFINGTLQFYIRDIITVCGQPNRPHADPFKLSLAYVSRSKTSLTVTTRADNRGTTKTNNIHYEYPHLFKF